MQERTTVGKVGRGQVGVFIGRPTKWGNPFVIGRDGNRSQVIRKYTLWLWQPKQKQLREAARKELRGQHLLCFCAPQFCHGHILASVSQSQE